MDPLGRVAPASARPDASDGVGPPFRVRVARNFYSTARSRKIRVWLDDQPPRWADDRSWRRVVSPATNVDEPYGLTDVDLEATRKDPLGCHGRSC
jgi:hypothetical protein